MDAPDLNRTCSRHVRRYGAVPCGRCRAWYCTECLYTHKSCYGELRDRQRAIPGPVGDVELRDRRRAIPDGVGSNSPRAYVLGNHSAAAGSISADGRRDVSTVMPVAQVFQFPAPAVQPDIVLWLSGLANLNPTTRVSRIFQHALKTIFAHPLPIFGGLVCTVYNHLVVLVSQVGGQLIQLNVHEGAFFIDPMSGRSAAGSATADKINICLAAKRSDKSEERLGADCSTVIVHEFTHFFCHRVFGDSAPNPYRLEDTPDGQRAKKYRKKNILALQELQGKYDRWKQCEALCEDRDGTRRGLVDIFERKCEEARGVREKWEIWQGKWAKMTAEELGRRGERRRELNDRIHAGDTDFTPEEEEIWFTPVQSDLENDMGSAERTRDEAGERVKLAEAGVGRAQGEMRRIEDAKKTWEALLEYEEGERDAELLAHLMELLYAWGEERFQATLPDCYALLVFLFANPDWVRLVPVMAP